MAVTLDRPYCTLAELKEFLRIATTNTDKDDTLKRAINNASRYIDDATGRIFYEKSLTDYYLPTYYGGEGWRITDLQPGETGGGKIWAAYKPIISITELVEDAVTLVENSDFYIDKNFGCIVRAENNWDNEPRAIKITGTFGYETDDDQTPADTMPGDIRECCKEIAARRSGEFIQVVQQEDGSISEFQNRSMPAWVKEILNKYAIGDTFSA
jgi:hypothetical protein